MASRDFKKTYPMTRRNLLGHIAAWAGLAYSTSTSFAAPAIDKLIAQNARFDWGDNFDTQMGKSIVTASNQPVLNEATITYLSHAIQTYENIVAAGGWPIVNERPDILKLGVTMPSVGVLRRRLLISGDLVKEAGISNTFDTYVDQALRRFQARCGLPITGVVDAHSLNALNVSAADRLAQLTINLQRLERYAPKTAALNRFVMVNIPAAELEAVNHAEVAQTHTVVVGKIDRQTPILQSKITQIILNPFWTVPQSIIKKDIIPLMQKDPDYLTDNNIHLYTYKGKEVLPSEVDWHTDQALNLLFRQDPGKMNAMSSTKINFSNPYAVYMHDTPQQSVFNNLMRFDSSGCIRVQNIREFNQWLLEGTPGWDRARMEGVIHSRENTPINLKTTVPLFFVYITAWATREGVVQFRDDVYQLDHLKGEAPSQIHA